MKRLFPKTGNSRLFISTGSKSMKKNLSAFSSQIKQAFITYQKKVFSRFRHLMQHR